MKNYAKRILSVLLAALMLAVLVCTALASTPSFNVAGGITASTGGTSLPADIGDDRVTVIFVGDEANSTLSANGNAEEQNDGSVAVIINKGSKVNKSDVPTITPADEYYEFNGWALDDGTIVNPANYAFSSNTILYAVVEDTWVPYVDMKQDRSDWFYKYVRDLSIAGVVNGYPDNTYNPTGEVKWGEALKLILLATGYPVQEATPDHWAGGYLALAYSEGFIAEDAVVDLNAPITRIEYAVIAAKALKLKDVDIQTPFADCNDEYVLQLYVAGIFEGSIEDGVRNFHPNNNIKRNEMSTVIWRINKYTK